MGTVNHATDHEEGEKTYFGEGVSRLARSTTVPLEKKRLTSARSQKGRESRAYPRATILWSPLGRLGWNCFNLLACPPAGCVAEAMRDRQDKIVKTEMNHLEYMVKVLASK